MRAPALAAAPNFRDCGGWRAADGLHVRGGLVFRSEALLEPTEADAAILASRGIVLVCDLRSDGERGRAPNRWWETRGVGLLELDILEAVDALDSPWRRLRDDSSVKGAWQAMESLYAAMPRAGLAHVVTILDRIAAGDLPMLIHCTAGKDRTGFVSAVLLAALGVPFDDIAADYLASDGRRAAHVRENTHRMIAAHIGGELPGPALDALLGVDRRYLEASFRTIADKYDDIAGYLAAGGVDRDRLERVRDRLLV